MKKTYASLKAELDDILAWFEGEDIDVDAAIAKYEAAIALTKELQTHLTKAENQLKDLQTQLPKT